MSNVTAALIKEQIIGSPFPDTAWVPKINDLRLSFPQGDILLGNKLSSVVAKDEPDISFDGDESDTYTILFVDPDAPSRGKAEYGLINHWIISGLKPQPNGKVLKTEPSRIPYAPPSARRTAHRSIFLLYKNLAGPLRPQEQQTAIKGAAIMERAFFDIKLFEEENKLELVGANFFISDNPGIAP
ncbi:PEBP-like protein [Meredithblackwellia eburnea MCA 4105]